MQEQTAVYNAIRATGSNAHIALEDYQGNFQGNTYGSMTNVHWDEHNYNWVTNYSTDVGANEAWIRNRIAFLQSMHSADGVIPVQCGEFGNATDGNHIDAYLLNPPGALIRRAEWREWLGVH